MRTPMTAANADDYPSPPGPVSSTLHAEIRDLTVQVARCAVTLEGIVPRLATQDNRLSTLEAAQTATSERLARVEEARNQNQASATHIVAVTALIVAAIPTLLKILDLFVASHK